MHAVWRRDPNVSEPVSADAIIDEVGELLTLLNAKN
jgi:hypothetical protein